MTVKDKYVDVRYHMKTQQTVKMSEKATHNTLKISRAFWWCRLVRMQKSKYNMTKDVWNVDYKAKYRMEC